MIAYAYAFIIMTLFMIQHLVIIIIIIIKVSLIIAKPLTFLLSQTYVSIFKFQRLIVEYMPIHVTL